VPSSLFTQFVCCGSVCVTVLFVALLICLFPFVVSFDLFVNVNSLLTCCNNIDR
jgi:hypothetical protein